MATHWYGGYSRGQLDQLASALQILLDRGLLGEDEVVVAGKLSGKVRRISEGEYLLVSDEEEKLLQEVEATLWRR